MIKIVSAAIIVVTLMILLFMDAPQSVLMTTLQSGYTFVKNNIKKVQLGKYDGAKRGGIIEDQEIIKYLSDLHLSLIGRWKRDDDVIVEFTNDRIHKKYPQVSDKIVEPYEVESSEIESKVIILKVSGGIERGGYSLRMEFFEEQKSMRSSKMGGVNLEILTGQPPVTPESGDPNIEYNHYTYRFMQIV